MADDGLKLDVAVIGGGVSGAYSAWRLQQSDAKARVALFEYSDRIGGRLFSKRMPGAPHVPAELGGMRYIPDSHYMVAGLVDHLELETKEFPMGAPAPVGFQCNLFYLRGKHLRYHELSDPDKVPYNMAWSERGMNPEELQTRIMDFVYPGFGDLSLCDQLKVKVFGKEIWKYGFWDLLYRVLSNEGYQFMKDAGGYEANVANANAMTQLPATEYKDDTVFLGLADGYDQLPIRLVEQFRTFTGPLRADDRVHMNHRLASLKLPSRQGRDYILVFQPTESRDGVTRDVPGADPVVVRAKKVILAMPRRSLELIESPLFEDSWLKAHLGSVLIQHAFKVFTAYEQPWWRSLGVQAGRSVTDLPIRQVYYFGTEAEQRGGLPFMNSVLMSSYNDIGTVPFWKGLEGGERFEGYRPACIEPDYDGDMVPQHDFPISAQMVEVVQRQLAQVHDKPNVPAPYSAIYQDWSADPYGGGWHEWKAGYRVDEVMCRMRKPVADQDVFVVGEAYSYEQGWVEGALDTAESMLSEFFGLERPRWLSMHKTSYLPIDCPGACGEGPPGGCLENADYPEILAAITPSCLGEAS